MQFKVPLASRYAAILMGFATIMHSIVALDLVLRLFPNTPEFQALWSTGALVKALWLLFVALGLATTILLYRAPRTGFVLSLVATACLYFASQGLWHELKGGFWVAVAASVFAALGAWRIQPNLLRKSA